MLDHVERRRLLVQPARKHPVPALVRLLHVDLDERPGQLFRFPRRGRLAGPQAHDHVFPPDRLAGAQRDVLDDPVALVEEAEDGDALRHRRHSRLRLRRRLIGGRKRGVARAVAALARGKRDSGKAEQIKSAAQGYSGIHGS
jgi:hypothetical protein